MPAPAAPGVQVDHDVGTPGDQAAAFASVFDVPLERLLVDDQAWITREGIARELVYVIELADVSAQRSVERANEARAWVARLLREGAIGPSDYYDEGYLRPLKIVAATEEE